MFKFLKMFQNYAHTIKSRFLSTAVNLPDPKQSVCFYENKITRQDILQKPQVDKYLSSLRQQQKCNKHELLTAIKLFNDEHMLGYNAEEKNQMMEKIWEEFRSVGYDIEHYNALYNNLLKNGVKIEAETFFKVLNNENIEPNEQSYLLLFKSACLSGDIDQADLIIDKLKDIYASFPPSYMSYYIVAKLLYGNLDESDIPIEEFNNIFNKLDGSAKKDFHNGLLLGYAKSGLHDKMMEFLDQEDCYVTQSMLVRAIPYIVEKQGDELADIILERCTIKSFRLLRNLTLRLAEQHNIRIAIAVLEKFISNFPSNSSAKRSLLQYLTYKTIEKYINDEENLTRYLTKIMALPYAEHRKLFKYIWSTFPKHELKNQEIISVNIKTVLLKLYPDKQEPLFTSMKNASDLNNEEKLKYTNLKEHLKIISKFGVLLNHETWDNFYKVLLSDSVNRKKMIYLLKTLRFTPEAFVNSHESFRIILRQIGVQKNKLYETSRRFIFKDTNNVEKLLKISDNITSQQHMLYLCQQKQLFDKLLANYLSLCRRYLPLESIEKILKYAKFTDLKNDAFFEYFMCNLSLNSDNALHVKYIENLKELGIDYGTLVAMKGLGTELEEFCKSCNSSLFLKYTSLMKAERFDDADLMLVNQTISFSNSKLEKFLKTTSDLNTLIHFFERFSNYVDSELLGKFLFHCIKKDRTEFIHELVNIVDEKLLMNETKIKIMEFLFSKGIVCKYTQYYIPYDKVVNIHLDFHQNGISAKELYNRLQSFTADEISMISHALLDEILTKSNEDIQSLTNKIKSLIPKYDPYKRQRFYYLLLKYSKFEIAKMCDKQIDNLHLTIANDFLNLTTDEFFDRHLTVFKEQLTLLFEIEDQEKLHNKFIESIDKLLEHKKTDVAFHLLVSIMKSARWEKNIVPSSYIETVFPKMDLTKDDRNVLGAAVLEKINISMTGDFQKWFEWCKLNVDQQKLQDFSRRILRNYKSAKIIDEKDNESLIHLLNDPQILSSGNFHCRRQLEIELLNNFSKGYLEILQKRNS